MRHLEELGFSRRQTISSLVVKLNDNDVALPAEYVSFLSFEPPEDLELGFRFLRADFNEEWEGQIVEFMNYDQATVNSAVVSPSTHRDRKLLPISADAGGSYLYLDLLTTPMRVVDVSYESGTISQVSGSFDAFLDILYPMEE